MNIDRAITIEMKTAETFEGLAEVFEKYGETKHAEKCRGGAKEHLELADWLKDLNGIIAE